MVSINPPYIVEMYVKIILTNDTTCDASMHIHMRQNLQKYT